MTEFGQELRAIRQEHNISLAVVAKKLRLKSPQYLYALEQGKIKASPKQAGRIVSILHKMGVEDRETLAKAYLADVIADLGI